MQDDCQRRYNSQLHRHHETACDHHTVNKIMDPIAKKIEIRERMDVAIIFMAMPPVKIALHEEKKHDPQNQVIENKRAAGFFEGLRQEVQERAADKCAGGETDEAKKNPRKQLIINGKGKSADQRNKTDNKCACKD